MDARHLAEELWGNAWSTRAGLWTAGLAGIWMKRLTAARGRKSKIPGAG